MIQAHLARSDLRTSVASLLIANVIPLVGVLAFGWSLLEVVALYWLECGVVGVFGLARMWLARGPYVAASPYEPPYTKATPYPVRIRLLIMALFVTGFGLGWYGYGLGIVDAYGPDDALIGELRARDFRDVAVGSALVMMVLRHGISFVVHYLRHERETADAWRETFAPSAKLFVLGGALVAGVFFREVGGQPVWGVVVLIVLKTALDLGAHLAAHLETTPRRAALG